MKNKRFPRKFKKKYIKTWGIYAYRNLLGGLVYMPYIPTICIGEFKPDKDLMSRYAAKPVNPKYYGTINVNGLL